MRSAIDPGIKDNRLFQLITKYVTRSYEITPEQLFTMCQTRKRKFCEARQMHMYLMKKHSAYTWASVAFPFGKDHSTAMASFDKIVELIEGRNKPVIERCREIEAHITIERECMRKRARFHAVNEKIKRAKFKAIKKNIKKLDN